METTENKKKEEINVGDYVKVVKEVFVGNKDNIFAKEINIYAKLAQVMYKVCHSVRPNEYVIKLGIKSGNEPIDYYEVIVWEDKIEKVELDDEIKKQMFGVDVIDEEACKKMHDFCYGKDVLKDVKIAMEVQDFIKVTSEMRELYKQKNHDYGNSFGRSFQKYGLISAITRMSDKWERIDSLCQKQAEVKDESIWDTLIDLANYCVMTIMELDKRKPDTKAGETFEMRLEKEWQELTNRIKKLSTFINSQKADSVSQYQRELLSEQLTHMTAYKVVLEKRITDLSQGNKQ